MFFCCHSGCSILCFSVLEGHCWLLLATPRYCFWTQTEHISSSELAYCNVSSIIIFTKTNHFAWDSAFIDNPKIRCTPKGCLVCVFKQPFSVFKQHFTHFNTFFHQHLFPQIFLNNNFQFLNTHTKRALTYRKMCRTAPKYGFLWFCMNRLTTPTTKVSCQC